MSAVPILVLVLLAAAAAVGLALRLAHFCRGLAWGRPQDRAADSDPGVSHP